MITAERLRACAEAGDVLVLFRELGYPMDPTVVDPIEWHRGGVDLPWSASVRLTLASRLPNFDLFLLDGKTENQSISKFITNYLLHNQATKSAVLNLVDAHRLALHDLDARGAARRLDIDLLSPSSHALDRLNLLVRPDEESAISRVYDRALDREALTREFFGRFKAAVGDLTDEISRQCPAEGEGAAAAEALLLMSRLLFLQFVQRKGWLDGDRRFLVDRVSRSVQRGESAFRSVITPLFFGCLNTPVDRRNDSARSLGCVPYLNGGLFEPSAFELRNDFTLSDDLLREVLEEVFERFDFSVDERDSAGSHIDPEMLGKVFESLMAQGERAASGSFYTPKPIVDAVSRRAIAEWLGGNDPELVRNLVEVANGGHVAMERDVALQMIARLEQLTILDPACGSGAFLLSALTTIDTLYRHLAADARQEVPADLRRLIIERSLFGVDLKAEAVRLCELRLWLSIVSGTDAPPESVQPLPNLDRNILQGNSLLGPVDHLGSARGDVYREWLAALRAQRDLVARYRCAPQEERPALCRLLRTADLEIARELLARAVMLDEKSVEEELTPRRDLFGDLRSGSARRVRELQSRLVESRDALARAEEGEVGFFSYDIHFAHVLANGGFDVVIGNPPWVRNSRIAPAARQMYADRYAIFRGKGARGFHQPDVALAFVEKATTLAASTGVIALLLPSKVANAGYASAMRDHLVNHGTLLELHDWTEEGRRWFDADTFPLSIVFRNQRPRDGHHSAVSVAGETFRLPQRALSVQCEWMLVPAEVRAIFERMGRHPRLEEALGRRPMMGVKTGNNTAFFLNAERLEHGALVTSGNVKIPLEHVCRCVRGRDVRRWTASCSEWMLWPPQHGWREAPPWATKFASEHRLDPRELRLAFVRPEHVGVQVIWKDVSRGMSAAVLPESVTIDGVSMPVVPNQTLYTIDAVSIDEAWAIAAVLNSTVAGAFLVAIAERAKDAHYRYFGRTVASLPLPLVAWESGRAGLVRLARRCAANDASAVDALDHLVAEMYALTPNDLGILRAFLSRRLSAG